MRSVPTIFASWLLATLTTAAFGANLGHTDTTSFTGVRAVIDTAIATTTPDKVLVVFDLDNTILATDSDFGSEHWFHWQSELIQQQTTGGALNPALVAPAVDGLLKIQGYIYAVTPMHATESTIAPNIQELAAQGVRFMALTSRGLDVRDATLRELARNGIDFTATAPGPRGGYAGAYLPYETNAPDTYGLTAADVVAFKLAAPKDVVFEHGVMLTQGQHKGSMLKTLLAKTGTTFDAIVFVDDRPHHSLGIQAAFDLRPEQVRTVKYGHEAAHIEDFRASDKTKVRAQWQALKPGIAAILDPGYGAAADEGSHDGQDPHPAQ